MPNSQLWLSLKVNKFQKHFFLKFHYPKNERNIRENSALESKEWSNQKDNGSFYVKYSVSHNFIPPIKELCSKWLLEN